MAKKLKISWILLNVLLIVGVEVLFFSNYQRGQVQALGSGEQEFTILTPKAHPEAGEDWIVEFETKGKADLTIMPQDRPTIDDLEFISLTCNGQERTPQILENGIVFYPNWECPPAGEASERIGKVIHHVDVAGKHTLKFQFGDEIAYAYNEPDSITDTFTDETKIASKDQVVVSGGQVKLDEMPAGKTTVYVTTASISGNMGGRSGADSFCINHKPSNLPVSCHTIHAFISVDSDDEIRDMHGAGGWYDSDAPIYWWHNSNQTYNLLANNWAEMLDWNVETSQENGTGEAGRSWSGSYGDGSFYSGCEGWTTNSPLLNGTYAYGDRADWGWIFGGQISCDHTYLLRCICICD